MSHLEDTLALQFRAHRMTPEREFRFHPKRKWKFDFAFPEAFVAVECEGGIWTNGAHTRGKHFMSDCEKYNAAIEMGWRVLRYPEGPIKSGEAIEQIRRVLEDHVKYGISVEALRLLRGRVDEAMYALKPRIG